MAADTVADQLPNPLMFCDLRDRIFDHLWIRHQALAACVCRSFRDSGPVKVEMGAALQYSDENGQFRRSPSHSLMDHVELTMFSSQGYPKQQHVWTEAPLQIPCFSQCVLVRMRMEQLRPNGGYCSLGLKCCDQGDREPIRGHVEIKFDKNKLRGYGSASPEDFGVPVRTVKAGQWFCLVASLDVSAAALHLSVDDIHIRTMKLKTTGWDAIEQVIIKGYSARQNARVPKVQGYSHILAARKTSAE